jgi:conjugal transfer pilus assembly protein TraD
VRALEAAGQSATPARLLELMDPRGLELLARQVPDEAAARRLFDYLDALDSRQRTGLSGTRDRLAILAESELGSWLHPAAGVPTLDLPAAVRSGAVSYFRLEADRLPLLSRMLAAAIVGDLLTIAAACQATPTPTLVAIDEFSAIAPEGVARLFGRARAAGFSLLLATQELADLRAAAPELLEQVLGNVETVIAHRQSVPDSAELIARIAGTRPAWSSTEQLAHAVPTGRRTRTRSREFAIHPDVIRTLACGNAAVSVASAGRCAVARIFHP